MGVQSAADLWQQAVTGEPSTTRESGRPQDPLQLEADAEEGRQPSTIHIQKKLSALVDADKVACLIQRFDDAGQVEDALRIEDLRDQHQEHSWM